MCPSFQETHRKSRVIVSFRLSLLRAGTANYREAVDAVGGRHANVEPVPSRGSTGQSGSSASMDVGGRGGSDAPEVLLSWDTYPPTETPNKQPNPNNPPVLSKTLGETTARPPALLLCRVARALPSPACPDGFSALSEPTTPQRSNTPQKRSQVTAAELQAQAWEAFIRSLDLVKHMAEDEREDLVNDLLR